MNTNTDNSWVSFSDIMTGLMVIFLFISISYMEEVREKTINIRTVVEDYEATKDTLYTDLKTEFRQDLKKWKMELDDDLSIRFTNPEVLFQSGKSDIRPNFQQILDEFLPRYFNILLKDKYKDKISEIRIEGHTDTTPISRSKTRIPYIDNLKLSQQRSTSVMEYFVRSNFYENLGENKRKWLLFHLTANGLSYGRTLDNNKKYSYKTEKMINNEYSRRVEFRIVTTSEEAIKEVLKKLKELQQNENE